MVIAWEEATPSGAAHDGPGPGDVAAGRDLRAAVRDRLPDAERDLLDRRLSGQEWAEIASAVGGGAEALRKRLTRAIDDVAGRLGLLEGEP